jgi:hypothetical protein
MPGLGEASTATLNGIEQRASLWERTTGTRWGRSTGDPAIHPRVGMFAGWIAHLLLARTQPVNWAELLVVGLAGHPRRHPRPIEVAGVLGPSLRAASYGRGGPAPPLSDPGFWQWVTRHAR